MIDTYRFGKALAGYGYERFTGVPCSFLKYLINFALNHGDYVEAANEGDAVAIAAGAFLGGTKTAVLMQNSGLTNALSPLTSLNYPFRIPLLGFVSLRGQPGIADAPQHELTGQTTEAMLECADAQYAYLSANTEEALFQLAGAEQVISENGVFFFIVRKNTFCQEPLKTAVAPAAVCVKRPEKVEPGAFDSRFSALEIISEYKTPDTALLSCTGKTSRELFTIGDFPNNFYMVGSMGCISSLGLGLGLARPDKKIIAIDGDGALIMRMGSLATNAYYASANLLHIVIDNGAYDSTGGQPSVSENIDFPAIAHACGYPRTAAAHDPETLKQHMASWQKDPVLTLLHVRVKKGAAENLQRPDLPPHEIKNRFMSFMGSAPGKAPAAGARKS